MNASPEHLTNRMAQSLRVLLGIAVAMLAVAWISYRACGHVALATLHAGGGQDVLAGVAERLQNQPLDYVIARLDTLVAMGMRVAALVWVLAALALDRGAWRGKSAVVSVGAQVAPGLRPGADGAPRRHLVAVAVLSWAALLAFLLAPWLWLKLVGLGLVAVLVAPRGGELVIPATGMRLLWYAVFLFAFVCAPYWTLPDAVWVQMLALAALLAGGWWWAGLTAAPLTITLRVSTVALVGVALAAAAFHLVPAGAGVPWSGDEDYHLTQVAYLCENLPPAWLVAGLGMLLFVRSHLAGSAGASQTAARLATTAAVCGTGYPHLHDAIARYPFLLRWFEAAPVQLLFPAPGLFYREAIFRASSVMCIMGLAAAVWLTLRRRPALGAAAALAAATLPTLQYYGSQLYLELPVIALLAVAALRAGALMGADADAVRRDPGWIALVLAAFAKETLLPVLAAFIGCRLLRCAWTHRGALAAWAREARLAISAMAPLVIYLGFRATQDIFRGYPGIWENFLRGDLWRVLAGSLWEQLGLLVVLGVIGTIAFCRRGSWGLLWLWGWLAAVTLFNLGDVAEYVGYSRYNLMLLPPLLAAGVWWLTRADTRACAVWLGLWLVVNLALSPLRAEGARQFRWGNPQADVGERYYPFRDAFAWIQVAAPDARILFAGTTYPYYWNFYFSQRDWYPGFHFSREQADADPAAAARSAVAAACTLMVWQPMEASSRLPARAEGFRLQRVFASDGVALAVYALSE